MLNQTGVTTSSGSFSTLSTRCGHSADYAQTLHDEHSILGLAWIGTTAGVAAQCHLRNASLSAAERQHRSARVLRAERKGLIALLGQHWCLCIYERRVASSPQQMDRSGAGRPCFRTLVNRLHRLSFRLPLSTHCEHRLHPRIEPDADAVGVNSLPAKRWRSAAVEASAFQAEPTFRESLNNRNAPACSPRRCCRLALARS